MTKKKFKRPFMTRYFGSITDGEKAWVTQGMCRTEDGAKRSTVVRLVLEQWAMARVYDTRTEVLLFSYKRTADGSLKKSFGREAAEGSNVVHLRRRLK